MVNASQKGPAVPQEAAAGGLLALFVLGAAFQACGNGEPLNVTRHTSHVAQATTHKLKLRSHTFTPPRPATTRRRSASYRRRSPTSPTRTASARSGCFAREQTGGKVKAAAAADVYTLVCGFAAARVGSLVRAGSK